VKFSYSSKQLGDVEDNILSVSNGSLPGHGFINAFFAALQ
jgi:hypothetical protein